MSCTSMDYQLEPLIMHVIKVRGEIQDEIKLRCEGGVEMLLVFICMVSTFYHAMAGQLPTWIFMSHLMQRAKPKLYKQ